MAYAVASPSPFPRDRASPRHQHPTGRHLATLSWECMCLIHTNRSPTTHGPTIRPRNPLSPRLRGRTRPTPPWIPPAHPGVHLRLHGIQTRGHLHEFINYHIHLPSFGMSSRHRRGAELPANSIFQEMHGRTHERASFGKRLWSPACLLRPPPSLFYR